MQSGTIKDAFGVAGFAQVSNDWNTVFQFNTNADGYTSIQTSYPDALAPPVSLTIDIATNAVSFKKTTLGEATAQDIPLAQQV